jgi:hypothetical protein
MTLAFYVATLILILALHVSTRRRLKRAEELIEANAEIAHNFTANLGVGAVQDFAVVARDLDTLFARTGMLSRKVDALFTGYGSSKTGSKKPLIN